MDLSHARVEGAGVLRATSSGGKLVVEIDAARGGPVVVRTEGACPVLVSRAEARGGGTLERRLVPWLDLGGPLPEVGFDRPLELTARPGCPEAARGRITWKQSSGAPLREAHTEQDGRRFVAKMPRLEDALGGTPRWGIVPISPRTRGDVTIEATWAGPDGTSVTRTVHAAAAARARGLPNVTVGARLYLGGSGWRVVSAPVGSHAALESKGGATSLSPDVRGGFTLSSEGGKTLRLVAGKYDETPLDCGRSDCHAEIARAARSSPMSTILQRGLDGPFAGDYPACALGCHAVGEPGLDDGGFAAVATALGRSPTEVAHTGWHELPAVLRRLGGVGCLACHGPGAIPEPGGRHALLRADVCATCHDAPPRYGHVVAWRASRMAVSDADARTTAEPCARCHTTWGFLGQSERRPPGDQAPQGIACAACHAVHPAKAGEQKAMGQVCAAALRRDLPTPDLLEGALTATSDRSRACLPCHTPLQSDAAPTGTAAAIWAARGGLSPITGAPLAGPAPHVGVEGGCVGCHRSGPPGLARGAGHAFRVDRRACTACHEDRSDRTIHARAEALSARLMALLPTAQVVGSGPAHASTLALDRSTPAGRAAWDVALVLEDPAADAHNAPYARELLDAAELALASLAPGRGPSPRRAHEAAP
jgi:hypothetical protein